MSHRTTGSIGYKFNRDIFHGSALTVAIAGTEAQRTQGLAYRERTAQSYIVARCITGGTNRCFGLWGGAETNAGNTQLAVHLTSLCQFNNHFGHEMTFLFYFNRRIVLGNGKYRRIDKRRINLEPRHEITSKYRFVGGMLGYVRLPYIGIVSRYLAFYDVVVARLFAGLEHIGGIDGVSYIDTTIGIERVGRCALNVEHLVFKTHRIVMGDALALGDEHRRIELGHKLSTGSGLGFLTTHLLQPTEHVVNTTLIICLFVECIGCVKHIVLVIIIGHVKQHILRCTYRQHIGQIVLGSKLLVACCLRLGHDNQSATIIKIEQLTFIGTDITVFDNGDLSIVDGNDVGQEAIKSRRDFAIDTRRNEYRQIGNHRGIVGFLWLADARIIRTVNSIVVSSTCRQTQE